jgi:hypothetical protein
MLRTDGWREAGRAWDTAARRVRAEARGGGLRSFLCGAAEANRLRVRARAARETARALETLRGGGYVVFHDRVIAGTSEVLDHILAGPPGLVLVQAHPVTRLHRDEAGVLHDAGAPFPAELGAVSFQAQQVLTAVAQRLPGWQLICYPALSIVGAAGWRAWPGEPASMFMPRQLCWWARTLPAPLAPIHVADLALAVDDACPPRQG